MTPHCMIDIETWSILPAAMPIAIGACKFDPSLPHDQEIDKFYVAIDPRSAQMLGLHIDSSTLCWWMEKAQREALDRWLDEPKIGLQGALDGFAEWYGDESLPTWSRGPAFDAVILETAFKVCGLKRPWHFRQDRDCRTIRGLMPSDWKGMSPSPGKHNALDDAAYQTQELLLIAHELGLTLR